MPIYHGFPRPSMVPKDVNYDVLGLDILRSIVDVGLLIVPEIIQFDEHYANGAISTLEMTQKRLCLTDIEPERLEDHSIKFGKFLIEWPHSVAMEMGAMPVFYFPAVTQDASGLMNLTGSLICRLAETKNLLSALHDLLKQLKASDPALATVLRQAETGQLVNLDTPNTIKLLEHFDSNYRGFFPLQANLRTLAQLFVPTHAPVRNDDMAYYRQREWRIISDITINRVPTSRELTQAEKQKIVAVNPVFFEREIHFPGGLDQRINQCRMYVDPYGKNPLHKATSIYVPPSALKKAQAILGDAGINVPVRVLRSGKVWKLINSARNWFHH